MSASRRFALRRRRIVELDAPLGQTQLLESVS